MANFLFMVIALFTFFIGTVLVLGICFFQWHPDAGRFYSKERMIVLGHRGYLKNANENTIGAIKDSFQFGADGAEVDIRQTKDGYLILHHNTEIQNNRGASMKISNSNYSDLIKFQKLLPDEKNFEDKRLPLLQDVWVKITNIKLINLEIKAELFGCTGFEEQVIDYIRQYSVEDITLISSFNMSVIRKVKKLDKTIQTALLWQKNKTGFFWFLPILFTCIAKADALHLHIDLAEKKIINTCHRLGVKVSIWTVNSSEALDKVRLLRADGIITDKTELIRKII